MWSNTLDTNKSINSLHILDRYDLCSQFFFQDYSLSENEITQTSSSTQPQLITKWKISFRWKAFLCFLWMCVSILFFSFYLFHKLVADIFTSFLYTSKKKLELVYASELLLVRLLIIFQSLNFDEHPQLSMENRTGCLFSLNGITNFLNVACVIMNIICELKLLRGSRFLFIVIQLHGWNKSLFTCWHLSLPLGIHYSQYPLFTIIIIYNVWLFINIIKILVLLICSLTINIYLLLLFTSCRIVTVLHIPCFRRCNLYDH